MKASIKSKRQRVFILFSTFTLGGLMVLSSCAPLYLPNSIYVPMVEEQGDINATASVGNNGYNLQAGIALTDYLLVMGGLAGANNGKSGEEETNHSFWEFGLGYYTELDQNIRFNILAGYGWGNTLALQDPYADPSALTYQVSGEYSRVFLQPAICLVKKDFELSFISRFSYVDFPTIASGCGLQNITADNMMFMEPVVNIIVGWRNVKFYAQTGFSLPYDNNKAFQHQAFIIASGALINLKLKKN